MNTVERTSADGERRTNGPSVRARRRLHLPKALAAAASLAAVAIVLIYWPRDDKEDGTLSLSADASDAWHAIAADVSAPPALGYTAEELGLYEMVDAIVFYRPYYARARTLDEFDNNREALRNYLRTESTGHERERMLFEFEIESLLLTAFLNAPADLSQGGILEQAHAIWMTACLGDAGFPDVVLDSETRKEVPIYQAELAQLQHYSSDTGFTYDDFFDLRLDCAKRAVDYPTLDPSDRRELIARLRKYYLQAVHEYLESSEVVAIPVENDERHAHPLEESYIQRCLEMDIAERPSCAGHHRVQLSREQLMAPVPEHAPMDELTPYPLVGQPCEFSDLPGQVFVDSKGNYCDKFENLEFIINHPDTIESQSHVSNLFFGGSRLLICPNQWIIDDEGKCRYPRPEEAALRAAFVEKHPEYADANAKRLYSSDYPDKN